MIRVRSSILLSFMALVFAGPGCTTPTNFRCQRDPNPDVFCADMHEDENADPEEWVCTLKVSIKISIFLGGSAVDHIVEVTQRQHLAL